MSRTCSAEVQGEDQNMQKVVAPLTLYAQTRKHILFGALQDMATKCGHFPKADVNFWGKSCGIYSWGFFLTILESGWLSERQYLLSE